MRSILLSALLLTTACSVVGPGERGIRISLGSVSEDVKPPGPYLWIPFILGITKINVQIQKSEIHANSASKDMQEVNAQVAVNWSLSPDKVVDTYKTIGDESDVVERILAPAVQEVVKSATAKLTAEEVLTKRMDMKTTIDDSLKTRLNAYGITVHDVSIMNLSFSKEFTNAIEQKQIKEQEAKAAEYTALKATQEARAQVERAKGQAQAQALLKSTITSEILQKEAMKNGTESFLSIWDQAPCRLFI